MPVSIEQVISDARLLSLPDIYIRLKAVLDDPDFAMAQVVEVINQDPGITARLLRMVNSPYFGFAAKIDNVSRAVGMLGTQQVHDLVLATSVAQVFTGMSREVMDMTAFWRSSVYTAVAARLLASQCNLLDSERLFVTGLLCHIGHLPMFQSAPDLAQEALEQATREEKPLYRIERALFGFDYAEVGGLMMQKWSLPKSLWEVIRYHTEPANSDEFPLQTAIVHIASLFAAAVESAAEPKDWLARIDPHSLQETGLDGDAIAALKTEADEQLEAAVSLVFGGLVRG